MQRSSRRPRTAKKQKSIFTLTSTTSIFDYLRHAPHLVEWVEFGSKSSDQLISKVNELLPANISPKRSALSEGVSAGVRVETVDENEFLEEISHTEQGQHTVLALDHIQDPRNLGAIARACAYYGVRYIITPRDRSAPITDAAVETARTGFIHTSVVQVTNLARVLRSLKEQNFWIFGLAQGGESLQAPKHCFEKRVLVLGSEDKGLAQQTAKICDFKIGLGPSDAPIDSLNVAVAAGIGLNEIYRLHTTKG